MCLGAGRRPHRWDTTCEGVHSNFAATLCVRERGFGKRGCLNLAASHGELAKVAGVLERGLFEFGCKRTKGILVEEVSGKDGAINVVSGGAENTMAGAATPAEAEVDQILLRGVPSVGDAGDVRGGEIRSRATIPFPPGLGSPCEVWSWGCAKLIRHGAFQSFRVEHLNNADGHDLAAPNKVDFPTSSPSGPTPLQPEARADQAVEEVSALQQAVLQHPAQSNGSSQQSKRPKRNGHSAYARDSPINSQGGVTSSSPADEVVPDENGASTVHHRSKDGEAGVTAPADTAGPESPAVIDAEHHENGVHKRPRRLTAGDWGLAQALQYERPRKVTTPKPVADVKPSPSSLAAAVKRPKRVTAGLKGIALAAENAKSAPRVSVKKEPKKDAVHQVSVQTRSASAKPSKKNKKLGDLY